MSGRWDLQKERDVRMKAVILWDVSMLAKCQQWYSGIRQKLFKKLYIYIYIYIYNSIGKGTNQTNLPPAMGKQAPLFKLEITASLEEILNSNMPYSA